MANSQLLEDLLSFIQEKMIQVNEQEMNNHKLQEVQELQ